MIWFDLYCLRCTGPGDEAEPSTSDRSSEGTMSHLDWSWCMTLQPESALLVENFQGGTFLSCTFTEASISAQSDNCTIADNKTSRATPERWRASFDICKAAILLHSATMSNPGLPALIELCCTKRVNIGLENLIVHSRENSHGRYSRVQCKLFMITQRILAISVIQTHICCGRNLKASSRSSIVFRRVVVCKSTSLYLLLGWTPRCKAVHCLER